MSVGGTYDVLTKTPMGDQKGVFTVVPSDDGSSFTGSIAGDLATMEIKEGAIDGNTLTWKMDMTVPMPLELEGNATVEGDQMTGSVDAGSFGTMELTGQRRS